MFPRFDRLRQRYHFLAHQALYPVLLSTLLAIGLFAGRVFLMEQLDQRQAFFPEASMQVRWQETENPGKSGGLKIFISSWEDEYERSCVQCFVEFSVNHALQLHWEKLSKYGVLKVFLNSWEDSYGRAFEGLLVELSMSHKLTYAFLVWNLFLAWIPYMVSLWAVDIHQSHPRRWWYLVIPGLLWLIFFPNAPYIVTDFFHLRTRPPIPIWYDTGMLLVFAWTGLFLGVFSLRAMQTIVKNFVGSIASWLFVVGSLGLGGLGIYVGRFLRWNSWDLFFHPRSVFTDMAIRLANPGSHPGTFGVTLLFAAFLLVCYLTFTGIPTREQF